MRKMLILLLTLSILLSGCADFGFAHVDGNAAVIDKTAGDAVENLVYFEDSDVAFPAHTREYAMCLGGNYYLVFKAPYSYAVVDDNSEIYCTDNIFCGFGVTNNHIWVLENQPDNGHNVFILTKISPHPDVKIETFQITEFDGGKSLPTINCSRDYVIVNVDNETIYLFDELGILCCQIELPTNLSNKSTWRSLEYKNEILYVEQAQEFDNVYKLKTDTGKLEKLFSCDAGVPFMNINNDQFMIATDIGIDLIDDEGNSNPYTVWSKCGFAISGIDGIRALDSSKYLLHDLSGFRALTLNSDLKHHEKRQLILASLDPAYGLQKIIAGFNYSNSEYYVTIKDYSENGSLDSTTALLRFNTDIISNSMPDIVSFRSISPYPLIRKGLLENLVSYIDQDQEIGRNNIAILHALEKNNEMFLLGSGFTIETLEGKRETFGDRYGWTIDEYLKRQETFPEGQMIIYNLTLETIVEYILPRYAQKAINWENGTCDFDNPQFISLLKQGKQIHETPEDPDNMMYGDSAVMLGNGTLITSLSMLNRVWSFAEDEKNAGCKLSAIGWPTLDGSCGSDIYLTNPVGIIKKTDISDGCWQFLKYIMLYGAGENGLSIYMPEIEKKISNALEDDELQDIFTRADADSFLIYLNQIDNIRLYDTSVMSIIRTECNKYINGQYSAEEAARVIQSKIGLYIAEQG